MRQTAGAFDEMRYLPAQRQTTTLLINKLISNVGARRKVREFLKSLKCLGARSIAFDLFGPLKNQRDSDWHKAETLSLSRPPVLHYNKIFGGSSHTGNATSVCGGTNIKWTGGGSALLQCDVSNKAARYSQTSVGGCTRCSITHSNGPFFVCSALLPQQSPLFCHSRALRAF